MRRLSASTCAFSLGSIATFLVLGLLGRPAGAEAQEIPRTEYLRYVPLEDPRIIRQTEASARLHLYGDRSSFDYVDIDPIDGMDDHRAEVLHELGVRFAPFMVQNTEAIPMDFKLFGRGSPLPMHIDTWNTAMGLDLARFESIDWLNVASDPCSAGNPTADDCTLLRLLEDFHPDNPASAPERTAAIEAQSKPFRVMWVDFPGQDPLSWKEHFENPFTNKLREQYRGFLKTYVHPFLEEVEGLQGSEGYQLVLQYWFFYPYNDGGNNHEGDWEHIHVIVTPKSRVTQPALSKEDLLRLLDGDYLESEGDDQLVIKRVEYYFHSKVATFDYSSPNVYQPRADWEEETGNRVAEYSGEEMFWKFTRGLAYEDLEETRVNTHPVAYIGADNKGLDQLLASPGGRNRDSHGTFPTPALYKDIGPLGAAENITNFFDHKKYFAGDESAVSRINRFNRGGVVFLGDPSVVEIVPDYERVIDLVMTDVEVRQEWAWLILPMRWGYPATESPGAGIVAHAETGNLSIVGPAFNTGWNRSGENVQYKKYAAHALPRLFPLSLQDNFVNDWGFLNLTLPTLAMLPPLDIIWRLFAAPVRFLVSDMDPTLYPAETIPFRFVGLNAGVTVDHLPNDYVELFFNADQTDEIIVRLLEHLIENGADSTTAITTSTDYVETIAAPLIQVQFFIGSHFTSTNTVKHSRPQMGFTTNFSNIEQSFNVTGELNLWEYLGSLRYSILTGSIQPYAKAGYGISWYRLENVSTNGEPLEDPDSEWVRKAKIIPPDNLLPNTWHAGLGFEFIVVKSFSPLPRGIDVSITAEWLWLTNKLGVDFVGTDIETLIGLGVDPQDLPRERWVGRNQFNFLLTLSF